MGTRTMDKTTQEIMHEAHMASVKIVAGVMRPKGGDGKPDVDPTDV